MDWIPFKVISFVKALTELEQRIQASLRVHF